PAPSASVNDRWIFGGGATYTPGFANRATLSAAWWEYRFQRQLSNSYDGIKHIGAELDIDLTWVHSDYVTFAGGWANFQPGGVFYQAARAQGAGVQGLNPITQWHFDARVKF